MSKRSQIILTVVTILLITLPYLFAMANSGEEYVFNGFLLNPFDGNSYLAKMRLGWSGEWQFSLPFSAEQTQGGFLFLFYIFLGHLAKWLSLPLLMTFHLARITGAIILCLVLARFIRIYLSEFSPKTQTITFGLMCLGSGLGWLAAFFGGFTSDFWVAEAFPFLSMYSNPHFPLGMALIVGYFTTLKDPHFSGKWYWLLIDGLLLAIIMPFGVVVAGIVTAALQLWDIVKKVYPIRWWSLSFLVPGGLFLIYQYIVTLSDPLLVAWNLQNVTQTAPLWDVLISFSPVLIAAIVGIVYLYRQGILFEYRLFVVWIIAGFVLAYFPFQLQRRFLFGYFIPITGLAGLMLGKMLEQPRRFTRAGVGLFLAASFFTNLIILAGGLFAISSHDPKIYYPQTMQSAFDWMSAKTTSRPLVLASPETGLIIPGATGWRVIYGHPYETPKALYREEQVEAVYRGDKSGEELDQFIKEEGIDYIFYGPFEQAYGSSPEFFAGYTLVYSNREVSIFAADAGR